MGEALLPTIIGAMGNAAALILFLSPIPTFVRIIKERSTREFSGMTYVVTWLNCALWVLYGFRKAVILIITINMAGLVIQSIYSLIFVVFNSTSKGRKKMLGIWLLEAICTAALGVGVLKGVRSKETQINIFGWLCVALNIAMYWAPLSIMWTVISTKSVEFMPFFLTLMVLINSSFWAVYGLLKMNIYVIIPNAMGILGGAIQMLLYFIYFRTDASKAAAARNKAGKATPSSVEM